MSGRAEFWQGHWSSIRHEDGFWCNDGPGWFPAWSLTGKTVNLGGKDGEVYDGVTVHEVVRGYLVLAGGRLGWPLEPDREHVSADGTEIPVTGVARGFIHESEDQET